jgi:aminoglycoside phosphotransferase (APT) family kinase protein
VIADTLGTDGLVDVPRLGEWLATALPGFGGPLTVHYLPGGATNAVFTLTCGNEVAVLKRPPLVPRPDSEKVLAREARILAALNHTAVPAPRLLAWHPEHDVIGSAFYVMSFVVGWTPGDNADLFPAPFNQRGDERYRLGFALIDGIAALANVDYQAVGLEDFGKPGRFLDRQVDRWLGQLAMYAKAESYSGRVLPGMDYVTGWLRANTPESPRIGIIHGDYGFPNALFDRHAPARLKAMIDWELSTIGDPLLDLGLALYTFRSRDPSAPYVSYFESGDYPSREDLAEYYAGKTGLPIDKIDYYMVLAMFKLGVLLERKYAESLIGKMSRKAGDYFGDFTLKLIAAAQTIAQRSNI